MQGFQITSAREIQRNYRKLFDSVKKNRKPLFVMKGTEVEVVIVDPLSYEEMQKNAPQIVQETKQQQQPKNSHISRVPWRK